MPSIIPDIIALIGRCLGIGSTVIPELTWKSTYPDQMQSCRTLVQSSELRYPEGEFDKTVLSPDGQKCLVSDGKEAIYTLSAGQWEKVNVTLDPYAQIRGLAITNDGTIFVTQGEVITVIDAKGTPSTMKTGMHHLIDIVVDGDHLLASDHTKTSVWKWRTGEQLKTIERDRLRFNTLAIRNDIAVVCMEPYLSKMNANYPVQIEDLNNLESPVSWIFYDRITSIAFLDDTTLILGGDGRVTLMTVQGEELACLKIGEIEGTLRAIAVSKDKNLIAVADQTSVHLIAKKHPDCQLTHKLPNEISALNFRSDGTLVVATTKAIFHFDAPFQKVDLTKCTTDEQRAEAFVTLLQEKNATEALELVPKVKDLSLTVHGEEVPPLCHAISTCSPTIVKALLKLHVNVNEVWDNETPIEWALGWASFAGQAGRGDEWVEIIQALIDAGVTVTKHTQDAYNPTPLLRLAITSGSAELTRLLLKQDACSIEDLDDEDSMLTYAICLGNLDVVEAMIEDIDALPESIAKHRFPDDRAILTQAIKHPKIYALLKSKHLIQEKALHADHRRAAEDAVSANHRSVIRFLHDSNKLEVNARCSYGYRLSLRANYLLHRATMKEDHTLVNYLIELGASVDGWDDDDIYLLAELAALNDHLPAFNLVAEKIRQDELEGLRQIASERASTAVAARLNELIKV